MRILLAINSKFYLEPWIIYTSDKQTYMPNPDALYQDMQKLDDMYEELLWHPDDELQFTHDGQKIIIINKTIEEKMNETAERINGLVKP